MARIAQRTARRAPPAERRRRRLAAALVLALGAAMPAKAEIFGRLSRGAADACRIAIERVEREANIPAQLLTAIALVESGGGKVCRNNNILGWANGEHQFPSVRDGIHAVASRLRHSKLYRGKNTRGILLTYNGAHEYSQKVLAVMERLGPLAPESAPMD